MSTEYSLPEKENTHKDTNYYLVIQKYLKKQYPTIEKQEAHTLSREIVFAPQNYETEIKGTPKSISSLRENLAEFIERDNARNDFVPYSLDSAIADLIEKSNCETTTMNEYYRWITVTTEILNHMNDGEVTHDDLEERNQFIHMSYDRESEILLCLALYESAGKSADKEKIEKLKFKLARLREMRSIIRNTSHLVNTKNYEAKEKIQQYYQYCANLMSEKNISATNFNLKLNLNINHSNDEDLDENYSYIDYLRQTILEMMHRLEKSSEENQRPQNIDEDINTTAIDKEQEINPYTTSAYERESR